MPTIQTLYIRKSHRYADAWSHLDEWERLADVKVMRPRLVSPGYGRDLSEGPTHSYSVRVPKQLETKKAMSAIADMFSGSSCRHEYDCCGCPSTSARVYKNGRGRFTAVVRTSYNY